MECEYESDAGNNSHHNCMEVEAEESETSFLDLNDHCLLKVSRYLTLIDMINISRTCKRLNAVSEMVAKRFKHFHMGQFLTDIRRRKTQRQLYAMTECQIPTAFHMDRAVHYIAPNVESISTLFQYKDEDELLQPFKQYQFPKLKSLSLDKCDQLKWINIKNIEQLTVRNLERSELNNYASSMTKVKWLKFESVSRGVPISELLNFFENNPNIETFIMLTCKRLFPANFFMNSKSLKTLELSMNESHKNLECALQIENLTELILTNECTHHRVAIHNTIAGFLRSMAQKQTQTLKSIDFRRIYFEKLMDVLAPLNLVSMRFVTISHNGGFTHFYSKLASLSFPELKHLDIVSPVDMATFFTLIKHLTALEKIKFSLLRPYDKETFVRQLNQLVKVREIARPDLAIRFLIMSLKVKVNGIA